MVPCHWDSGNVRTQRWNRSRSGICNQWRSDMSVMLTVLVTMMKKNSMTLPTSTARQRWTSRSSLDQSLSLCIIHTMYTLLSWRFHLYNKLAHNSSSSVILFWEWFVNIHTYWLVAVTDGAWFHRLLVLINGCCPTAEITCKRLLNCFRCGI